MSQIGDLLHNAPSNWGRFGPDDEIGTLNYLTPAEVLRGIQHIHSGRTFPLGLPIGDPRMTTTAMEGNRYASPMPR